MTAPAYSINHDLREELDGAPASIIEEVRQEALHNLYFFAEGVLGYDQLRPEAHSDLCAFLMYDTSKRRMVLMPRGHLKSTIATITRSIQFACKDVNHARICIQNAEVKKAEAFLWEIQQHWEKGVVLRKLYPELIPDKFQGAGSDWSSNTASLKRDSVFKESTWTCIGAGGSGASQHFNLIIPDDIVGDRQKASPAEMQAVKTWNESQEALLDNEEDEICWVGTRKTMDDVYADTMEKWAGELAVFVREPIENGEPIFPLKYSLRRLERIMRNTPEVWAHDYMNNPIGKGGTDWGEYGIRDFWWGFDGYSVVFRDPQGRLKKWSFNELDIVMTVDANSGEPLAPDKAAVAVHGTSPDHEIFILSSRSGRPSPDGLVDWAYADAIQWHPRVVGFEKAGQQTTKFYFVKRCLDEGTYFVPEDLSHKNMEKPVRIRGKLDTPIKEQRLYTHPTQFNLRFQIQRHPQLSAHNWDEIDCAAYGPDLYQPGMRSEDLERREEAVNKIILLRGRTGYGRSFRRK
jgi:hypothetical protein